MASASRPAVPKRTDAAKLRAQQQQIAEDIERRTRIAVQGDTYQPPKPVSPSEKGLAVPQPRRRRRISSQGIATNTGRSNTTI